MTNNIAQICVGIDISKSFLDDGKQIASLLPVAPFDRQSGTYKGNAAIKGGRFHVRNIVYMAALTAVRWNPALRAF